VQGDITWKISQPFRPQLRRDRAEVAAGRIGPRRASTRAMDQVEVAVPYSERPGRDEPTVTRDRKFPRFGRAFRRWTVVSLLGAVAVAGALRYRATRGAPALQFETVTVDRGTIAAKVAATGTVSALVTVSVGSQVSGRIEKLFVDFGSVVRQGQTVATLDSAFFRAAVAQARANHAAAKASVEKAAATTLQTQRDFARAMELAADGLTSRAELEGAGAELQVSAAAQRAAEAGVAQTAAALEQAELNLRYTTIVSPINGIVISRNVDVGQTVAAALYAPTLLLIAQDLTRMQVDTNVAEADVGKIRAGMPVTFTVDAHPRRSFQGTVRQVRDNAQTIQNVVTYDAVIDVDNSERLLKPGMTANVSFVHATIENALRLPNAALRFKPDAAFLASYHARARTPSAEAPIGGLDVDKRTIWVQQGGAASPVTVQTGISDGSFTEVVSGSLRERDEIVVQVASAPSTERPR